MTRLHGFLSTPTSPKEAIGFIPRHPRAAVDALTGFARWGLPVYTLHRNPEIEGDKQDIHIASFSPQGDNPLRVEAERGHGSCWVNVLQRTATKVAP